ncbi:MAG: TonB-dependent receptor [Desulfosarcina sp.]|nr:TonB-dependent receptor [Desulfobacterales bacterium]
MHNIIIDSDTRNYDLFSALLQDEIMLLENRLWLKLGSKFEDNDYGGYEIQPNVRLFWAPHPKHKLWFAVSKAVRTPARLENDGRIIALVLPPALPSQPPRALTITGNSDYDSEKLMAYKLGYRILPAKSLSIDLTVFYNDYDKLRSPELAKVEGKAILTIGEISGFTEAGGIINLVKTRNRIKFEVNLNAAQQAGLKISSRILKLATIVGRSHGEERK